MLGQSFQTRRKVLEARGNVRKGRIAGPGRPERELHQEPDEDREDGLLGPRRRDELPVPAGGPVGWAEEEDGRGEGRDGARVARERRAPPVGDGEDEGAGQARDEDRLASERA